VALDYWRLADNALDSIDLPDKARRQLDLWWDIGFGAFVMYPRYAIEAFERLCAALQAVGEAPGRDNARLHGAMTLLAGAYGFAGQPELGLAKAGLALALADGLDTPMAGATLVPPTACLMAAGRIDELLETARRAATYLSGDLSGEPPSTRAARVGAIGIQNAVAFQGLQPDMALRDAALIEAIAQGDPEPFTVLLHFGVWYAWTGRESEALGYLEATAQKCRRMGAPPYIWALYIRPYVLWQRGEAAEALVLVEQALRYPHLAQQDFPFQLLRILKGHLHLDLGDLAAARVEFLAALLRGQEAKLAIVTMRALLGLAALAIANQDWESGRESLVAVRRMSSTGETRNPLLNAISHRLSGELAVARGRYAEARPSLTAALSTFASPEHDNLIEQAHVHRSLGRVAAADGRLEDAARAYARAGTIYHEIRNAHFLHLTSRLAESLTPAAAAYAVPSILAKLPEVVPAQPRRSLEGQYESLQQLLNGVRGHLRGEDMGPGAP
jgi:tetratricopeptide (TPR) repeat protein